MPDVILWIFNRQLWFYLGLFAIVGWQIWALWHTHHLARYTVFNIERENHVRERTRALILLFLFATLLLALLLSNSFIAPNLTELLGAPPTATAILPTHTPEPTVTPELVLPGIETATPEIAIGPLPTRTAVPPGGAGCQFPAATIRSPIPGAILAGVVEVQGTAKVDNFAFYTIEINTLGDNWLTLFTSQREDPADPNSSMKPIVDGVLGTWDTRLQEPGDYALRLTVYDAAGNYPIPCTIPITIQLPLPTATAGFP